MSNSGWIKLHRVLVDWEWYKTPNMVHFFVHCLLRANHEEKRWQGKVVSEGQFISGRKQLSLETGLSEQMVRTCIDKLKSTNELTSETTNQNTLFTLNSWKKYQIREESNQQSNQPATNEQPTSNHKQEAKEAKNEKNLLLPLAEKKPRKPDEIYDFLLKFFGYNYETMSKSQKSNIGMVTNDLKKKGATPQEIYKRANMIRNGWGQNSLTPNSIVKHWEAAPNLKLNPQVANA